MRAAYPVTAALPDFVPLLPAYFGEGIRARLAQAGPLRRTDGSR